jgi:hypothetical protein
MEFDKSFIIPIVGALFYTGIIIYNYVRDYQWNHRNKNNNWARKENLK